MTRRIKYLHYLLNKQDTDQISRFFWAQKRNPCKGDWIHLVTNDLYELGIRDDFEYIAKLKKVAFKNIVKEKARSYAFTQLMSQKHSHSKMAKLKYQGLQIQEVYTKFALSVSAVRTIFSFRVRMYAGNYGVDTFQLCPVCRNHSDKQELLAECSGIKSEFSHTNINDIMNIVYSSCVEEKSVTQLIEILNNYNYNYNYREDVIQTSDTA